ncbi:hypothetical protein [Actinomadura madurae]|uniref:hypothetical protein n=1 Tax=Actinomadura madurae TaxID=1993 RepID=UPI0020D2459C|nr:hypothetical protein [Actinomadura madurae]MCP9951361.1 hypothetical protein [Actinomadura madurae]MCP9968135.1 hypothetical protein [Actinomadura madurae]MCP9980594.1 hypothetical protein [Actinomadura madurae]MCQ0007892.1 hypothetical protein [Actinomadura madurae]MCQ0016796.1 hypothetical protein [Actinomadura madurae]
MSNGKKREPAHARGASTAGRLAFAILACSAVGGCSAEPPAAIEIGTAKGTGQRVSYPAAFDPSGYFAFDQWPAACSFLTAAEIRSVLPQATKVSHRSSDIKLSLIGSSREVTAKGARCTITFRLPGMNGAVLIDERTAGRRVTALPKSELPSGGTNSVPAGDGCAADRTTTEVWCARGRITFKISTPSAYQKRERSSEEKVRYSLAGKIVTFDRESAGGFQKKVAFEREHITIPFAKLIVAKL